MRLYKNESILKRCPKCFTISDHLILENPKSKKLYLKCSNCVRHLRKKITDEYLQNLKQNQIGLKKQLEKKPIKKVKVKKQKNLGKFFNKIDKSDKKILNKILRPIKTSEYNRKYRESHKEEIKQYRLKNKEFLYFKKNQAQRIKYNSDEEYRKNLIKKITENRRKKRNKLKDERKRL